MRIIQLLTTVSYGDAVSNDVLALHETLIKNGYRAEIYAENIDKRIHLNLVKKIAQIPAVTGEDVILYHLSTGTDLNFKLPRYKCRKIIIYHNITP